MSLVTFCSMPVVLFQFVSVFRFHRYTDLGARKHPVYRLPKYIQLASKVFDFY